MTDLTIDYDRIARRLLRAERMPLDGMAPLAEVLRVARPLQLEAGAVVVREGDTARELLVVARGSVLVRLKDASGEVTRVATLQAPLLLGHVAIVDDGARSATCEMATDGLVLSLPRRQVGDVLHSTSRGAEVMRDLLLAGMFRQLDQASARLRAYLQEHPEERVELRDRKRQ